MPPRSPTSSLSSNYVASVLCTTTSHTIVATVIELLANRFWYRSRARIQRMRSGRPFLDNPPTGPSHFSRLPLEIIEKIIAYLAHNMGSLRACSFTCYFLYIAAVPHLHRPLIIGSEYRNLKYIWPNPIRRMHKLGLLPLVEELKIRIDHPTTVVSQQLFKPRILRQFMAFTNVQDLQLGYLDIPSFMPGIRQCFGPFLPTVKSLTLVSPRGSYQQVIFFIGSFQHLEDLMLHDDTSCTPGKDSALIPPFVPPLQGRLVVWCLRKEGFLRDMVRSFGGIKFSKMDIYDVAETGRFLGACSKTLRSLQLHPPDPHGERQDLKRVMRF